MPYRVDYSCNAHKQKKSCSLRRRRYLTGFCFLLFLFLVTIFWPEGREVLRRFFIPGDPDLTLAAVETFCQDLISGIPFQQAAQTFYKGILSHGSVF